MSFQLSPLIRSSEQYVGRYLWQDVPPQHAKLPHVKRYSRHRHSPEVINKACLLRNDSAPHKNSCLLFASRPIRKGCSNTFLVLFCSLKLMMMNLNVKTREVTCLPESLKLLHVRELRNRLLIDWLETEQKPRVPFVSCYATIACCQFEDGKDGELWGKKWIHAREVNHQLSEGFPPRICAVYLRLNFQDPKSIN